MGYTKYKLNDDKKSFTNFLVKLFTFIKSSSTGNSTSSGELMYIIAYSIFLSKLITILYDKYYLGKLGFVLGGSSNFIFRNLEIPKILLKQKKYDDLNHVYDCNIKYYKKIVKNSRLDNEYFDIDIFPENNDSFNKLVNILEIDMSDSNERNSKLYGNNNALNIRSSKFYLENKKIIGEYMSYMLNDFVKLNRSKQYFYFKSYEFDSSSWFPFVNYKRTYLPNITIIKPDVYEKSDNPNLNRKTVMRNILDTFDFSVCRIGYLDKNTIVFDDKYISDSIHNRLHLRKLYTPQNLFYRINKYINKGYKLEDEEIKNIYNQIFTNKDNIERILNNDNS